MTGAVAELLPFALGVAISPEVIFAALLFLMTTRAKQNGVAFFLGWTTAIALTITIVAALGRRLPEQHQSGGSGWGAIVVPLIIGTVFGALAIILWRTHRRGGEMKHPAWMQKIESVGPGKTAAIAFLLGVINLKTVMLGVHAGYTLAGAAVATKIVGIAVYTLVGVSTVALPVLAVLFGGERFTGMLHRVRGFLEKNWALIVAIVSAILALHSFIHLATTAF
ncbi:MAG: GAP family protein [Gordonia sp. (in: high G+C Gram-positive bacteria)]|uniref:GAP family protein n=1 Tax=Gordonia sp. (in: high G+C Gram-positive bacteria) TaxID=84139 RepID=UPI0039E435F3